MRFGGERRRMAPSCRRRPRRRRRACAARRPTTASAPTWAADCRSLGDFPGARPPAGGRGGDVLHGSEVADPYRWLEAGDGPEPAWVAAQNERTRQALDALPIVGRGTSASSRLLAAPIRAVAWPARGVLAGAGRGCPAVLLVVRSATDPSSPARPLVDPAGLATDATTAIDWYHPSPDGGLVAYGMSEGGDERSVLRVLDVETGAHLGDEIPETRAATVGWLPDASGFLYTRYPEGAEYGRMVYEHRLGMAWREDALVWGDLRRRRLGPTSRCRGTAAGCWSTLVSWSRTDVHLLDRRPLADGDRGHRGHHRAERSTVTGCSATPTSTPPAGASSRPR